MDRWARYLLGLFVFCVAVATLRLFSAPQDAPRNPAPSPAAPGQTANGQPAPFYLHALHAKQLQLDCATCHTPVKEGSVELKRPGHDQCMTCHQEAFGANLNAKICAECHTQFPPTGDDLFPFPRYQKKRAILFQFSHAQHLDPQVRINPKTGFRADCTFCHQFDAQGNYATFPGHPQCATCHAKPGMKPQLSPESTTADCRGCHMPEEIENPGFAERRLIAPHIVAGKYVNLRFTHIAHFRFREQYHLNCTTCHYAIPESTSLETLALPKMIDCVECHDTSKIIPAQFRMSNCQTCHLEKESGAPPASHTRYIRPAFHTESFRLQHAEQASASGAKCFVCHTNVSPSATHSTQCISCHQVMRPASHTARWRDDIHGKFATIDRQTCALCHTTDYCSRCHNQTPESHIPLAQFKNGGHARLAMLDERACLTCHTHENTCAVCHTRTLR